MDIAIGSKDETGPLVPETILGQNIEMCLTTAHGLLSERLRNPKFVGPPHRMTGLAPEWQGASCGRGFYELTPGGGLMGSEAQLISVPNETWNMQLHQNRIQVRAGETLELEMWARAWRRPVRLRVDLRPLSSRAPAYDGGEILVDKPWYARYTLRFKMPADDNQARLAITLPEGGELWIDQLHLRPHDQPLLCQTVVDTMATMRIPALRFPGGIVVNAYNWRHGTGPVHLRPAMLEAAFHQNWELVYDFGLDEYLTLCLDQGIIPTLTLNVATGTPDEAGELAAYVARHFRQAGVEPPMAYWHIANHPYSPTTAHMTPAMYAEVLNTFVPIVKANYPTCRIVGVMPSSAMTTPAEAWKEMLFAQAALIDVVQVQLYGGCDPNAPAAVQSRTNSETLASFEKQLRAFIAESRARGATWKLGVAEWNWWMQASHWDGRAFEEPPTALHGLFIAGMIHRYAALAPDFEVAHFYNLVNCMGILNHRGAEVEITSAVAVFKLYRPALPGRRLALDLATENGDWPNSVDAIGLDNGPTRYLFLANRDDQQTVRVKLDASLLNGQPEATILHAPTTLDELTTSTTQVDNGTLELPPLSLVRLASTT